MEPLCIFCYNALARLSLYLNHSVLLVGNDIIFVSKPIKSCKFKRFYAECQLQNKALTFFPGLGPPTMQ